VTKHLEGLSRKGKTLQQLRHLANTEEARYVVNKETAEQTAMAWLHQTQKACEAAAQLETDTVQLGDVMDSALDDRAEHARCNFVSPAL
jgi:hypothetical protein